MDSEQAGVLDFWFRELNPQDWFEGGERLDPLVRSRFDNLHRQAAGSGCDQWRETPLGRLALIIVRDQFSRHIYRFTALRDFAEQALAFAQGHADEIDRLGRFSHRNEALSRPSTEQERAFLRSGEATA